MPAVHCVQMNQNVNIVINEFSNSELSFFPVIDDSGKCIGVISAADILYAHRNDLINKDTLVWEVSSMPVIEVAISTQVQDAILLMQKNRIHHLVVCDVSGVIGVISVLDLLKHFVLQNVV
jgi:signal-transduction protein with cAMP-binding, CBS, and nucleotidyltransferase domain